MLSPLTDVKDSLQCYDIKQSITQTSDWTQFNDRDISVKHNVLKAGFNSPSGKNNILKPTLFDKLYCRKASHSIQQNQHEYFLYYFYLMSEAHSASKRVYTKPNNSPMSNIILEY
jgi:hypothetical protein